MARKNNEGAYNAWQAGKFFQNGSVSTRQTPDGSWAIYSYATPILYYENGELKLNLKRYSVTTSTLQNYLFRMEGNRANLACELVI